jgi:serine protease Do/serine protease DegQ
MGYDDFIHLDVSLNPGNLGGALINLKGELVGINTAIVEPNDGNIGLGLATPINLLNPIITQIIQSGDIKRGELGIQIQDLTPELADAFNIKQHYSVIISGITPKSQAEKAGLQIGDVIIAMNGHSAESIVQIRNLEALMQVGNLVSLAIFREGGKLTKTMRFARQ